MSSPFNVFSSKSTDFDKDYIIKNNNIIEVARELGVQVSKNTVPCIRQHNHVVKNGSSTMSFNVVANSFKCWVCPDVGGSVLDLVMQVKDVDEASAVQYLAIRSDTDLSEDKSTFFSAKNVKKIDKTDKEDIYKQFFDGLDNDKGIDLIAFASTKGGTGKSLIANNISVLISLIARYIGNHSENNPQNIEMVDLDFGKPDQRLLFNSEPKHYIEDMFYNKGDNIGWDDLREFTPLDNLNFVSPCPVRKSSSLYYQNKNEILYMLHNSPSLIKLADFGGGSNKDTLDFLSNIKSKIFVLNPDRTSTEAVFNLILSLIYHPLKQKLKGSKEALDYLDEFRNYQRTGFTIEKFKTALRELDSNVANCKTLNSFYNDYFQPFKEELNLNLKNGYDPNLAKLKEELPIMGEEVNQILFNKNGNKDKFNYSEKNKIYKKFNLIKQAVGEFETLTNRLEDSLKVSLFGIIVNRSDEEMALKIKDSLIARVEDAFSMKLTYLGNIPDEVDLRNVSNYSMPFAISCINHPVLKYFYAITDNIIGLKHGSSERIINEQKPYVNSLKKRWKEKSAIMESQFY